MMHLFYDRKYNFTFFAAIYFAERRETVLMKKMKKNFKPENKTVEAMYAAYASCYCGTTSCLCNPDINASYNNYKRNLENLTSGFKNGIR